MHLLNNLPATFAQVFEDSELIDCLLARVRELRSDLDVENVAETLKYCLTILDSVSSSLKTPLKIKRSQEAGKAKHARRTNIIGESLNRACIANDPGRV
jgi:hypothetical protein